MPSKKGASAPPRIDPNQFKSYPRGFTLIPLAGHRKAPRDRNWTKCSYDTRAVAKQCASQDWNAGVRLTKSQLVIDVDPRNGGNEGFLNLCLDLGLDDSTWPHVITGSGGSHYYLTKPADVSVLDTLKEYPGVEFKSKGRQVVAAGSVHPDTNKCYYFDETHPPLTSDLPMVPKSLLAKITRQRRAPESHVASGIYSPEQLAAMLGGLDPRDFASNADWFPLMAACHHATGGAGLSAFVEWSTRDPDFADAANEIEARWSSLRVDKDDPITHQHLHRELREHNAGNLIPAADASDDFDAVGDDGLAAEADRPKGSERAIHPTPFAYISPEQVPPREWVYRPSYIRKFIGLTVATGGAGKSSLLVVEALAMASGRDLLGVQPQTKQRVWYWNGEDPAEELQRRVTAAMIHHRVAPKEIEGTFFLDSGRELPIKLATMNRNGPLIAMPVRDALTRAIQANSIDVLILDPFVSSHSVPENDNMAVELVAKEWAAIANDAGCAIHLAHHTRKVASGEAASISDSRGASALNYAARVRRAINVMSAKEAVAFGIEAEERARYFRADDSNSSMVPAGASLDWYRFESVNLGNGPAGSGDNVGVVVKWTPPDPDDTCEEEEGRAVRALAEGGPWRTSPQSPQWAGRAVAEALGVSCEAGSSGRKHVAAVIQNLEKTGRLVRRIEPDAGRRKREIYEVLDFG